MTDLFAWLVLLLGLATVCIAAIIITALILMVRRP